MSSLKGFIPGLARILGMNPASLYERQRVLVAARMLEVEGGRGPGSGVRLTVPAVITLLLSVLGSESLSESPARMETLLWSKPSKSSTGPLARQKSLLSAIRWLLVTSGEADSLVELAVSQNSDRAWFRFSDGTTDEFVVSKATQPAIERLARIDGAVVRQIAADVQAILEESYSEVQQGGAVS